MREKEWFFGFLCTRKVQVGICVYALCKAGTSVVSSVRSDHVEK